MLIINMLENYFTKNTEIIWQILLFFYGRPQLACPEFWGLPVRTDTMIPIDRVYENLEEAIMEFSERTIREDIRVMRSDMLGFNAPIVQKEGCYSYGERDYSIFKVRIRDAELLEAIPGREDPRLGIIPEKPSPEQPLTSQKILLIT